MDPRSLALGRLENDLTASPNRVVLLCPPLSILEQDKRLPDIQAGRPETISDLRRKLDPFESLRGSWEVISTRLLATEPQGYLGRASER